MRRSTLRNIGLEVRTDIPASEIFAKTFEPEIYGLKKEDKQSLTFLSDFVSEYNREIPVDTNKPIKDSKTAAMIFYPTLRELDREEVWVLFLTNANTPIDKRQINIGSLTSSTIDIRRIILTSLELSACGIILFHNHPSGSPLPSSADINQTEKLKKALALCDINLVDHIIVSESRYYSFADESVAEYPEEVNPEKPEHKEEYFEVSALSREDLEQAGFDANNVTDEQMRILARKMGEDICEQLYWISLTTMATKLGLPRK